VLDPALLAAGWGRALPRRPWRPDRRTCPGVEPERLLPRPARTAPGTDRARHGPRPARTAPGTQRGTCWRSLASWSWARSTDH